MRLTRAVRLCVGFAGEISLVRVPARAGLVSRWQAARSSARGTFAVTAKNARIGEQRLEHGVPPFRQDRTQLQA